MMDIIADSICKANDISYHFDIRSCHILCGDLPIYVYHVCLVRSYIMCAANASQAEMEGLEDS